MFFALDKQWDNLRALNMDEVVLADMQLMDVPWEEVAARMMFSKRVWLRFTKWILNTMPFVDLRILKPKIGCDRGIGWLWSVNAPIVDELADLGVIVSKL